jgi:UDP-N-acetylglucosamine 1-carboxyvinyltransferase
MVDIVAGFESVGRAIRMEGGRSLYGSVHIQGSKNSALPILAACILIPAGCIIKGCPDISDVDCMCRLLESVGVSVRRENSGIEINAEKVKEYRLPQKQVEMMRSSIILLGALLGRIGEVCINYPGGCIIGDRPIDLHLYGLRRLGAQIWTEGSYIHAYADELKGCVIDFPFSSVGATQNVILASVTARGTTVIKNASREPEIEELCRFLNSAGADIELNDNFYIKGRLVIHGVELTRLCGVSWQTATDRIVAGTYMLAVTALGGETVLENAPISHMDSVCTIVRRMGAKIKISEDKNKLEIDAQRGGIVNLPYVETDIYPEFPTDLQSQLLAVSCVLPGKITIRDRIFSSRFKIVDELIRMGADIILDDNSAVVNGGGELEGCNVIARELRGGAALVIAGLCANGITTVADIEYIRRGYEDIVGDFLKLGARIGYVD